MNTACMLRCAVEETFDRYAVAVLKNGEVAGHVPRELSSIFCKGSTAVQSAESLATGNCRGSRKEPNCSVRIIFTGKQRHVQKLLYLVTYLY